MSQQQISIPNRASRVFVVFTAEISPVTVEGLLSLLVQVAKKNVGEVYLALSTPGGEVMSGITLYNALSGFPFKLVVHNIGSVNSIGNAVFLAGEERYAAPNSTFMFHGVGFDLQGPMRVEEQFLRDRLDSILADQTMMGQIIVRRSSIGDDEVASLFRTQKTKDANWAKENGLINEIRDFSIPEGSPIISLVFQRQVTQ